MKYFDYIRFGLKNIGRQKARTILTIFAIMIGATSVVAMLTLVVSAKKIVVGQIESAGALTQVTVSANTDITGDDVFNVNGGNNDSSQKLTDATTATLAAIPHVSSATPLLTSWYLRNAALSEKPDKKINFEQIIGIDPSAMSSYEVSAGRNLMSSDYHNIVIGSRYLEAMGYKGKPADIIGKTVTFYLKGYTGPGVDLPQPPAQSTKDSWKEYNELLMNTIVTMDATIVGVLASSMYDNQAYVPMKWMRDTMLTRRWEMDEQKPQNPVNGQPYVQQKQTYHISTEDQFLQAGYATIILKVDAASNVAGVATAVKALKLGAATAEEMIAQITKIFNMIGLLLGAVGAISLTVAAIGVINTMVMATLERTREIGVLRACGATRGTIRRLFTFEASLLGLWGGVFGVAVGYGLVFLARQFGGSALSGMGVNASQIQIPLTLALATVAATTIIGMLAGFFPALRASRLNPVEALRYE